MSNSVNVKNVIFILKRGISLKKIIIGQQNGPLPQKKSQNMHT
jgi:hypothetical protein